jgi:hypothetical protein
MPMTHEVVTTLAPEEIVRRAKAFFATHVPATGAFVEAESARHVVLRGQGGEEIVIAAVPAAGGSAVRASTLLFDQQVLRFFTTLPASGVEAA